MSLDPPSAIIPQLVTLFAIIFCYTSIIFVVNKVDRKLLSDSGNGSATTNKKQDQIRARVHKKITGYILIFIFQ